MFAICTLVVNRQASFMQVLDLGYARDGLLISPEIASTDVGAQRAFVEALRHVPGVVAASLSELSPDIQNSHNFNVTPFGPHAEDIHVLGDTVWNGYESTFRPRLLAGRWFDDSHGEDDSPGDRLFHKTSGRTYSVVLNRTAMARLGLSDPANAVGKPLKSGGTTLRVIGIVDDMRFVSAREDVSPQVTFRTTGALDYPLASARFSGVPADVMKARLKAVWDRSFPDDPGNFRTVQERMSPFYAAEQRRGHLFSIASCIAIAIACLGLYGLASFTALRRTHEVGIRKALGATTRDVLALMLRDFLRPVLMACVIAAVPAWVVMRAWLAGFHQRIALSPFDFAVVAMGAIGIAALTVLSQTLRVARAEPARALRAE